MDYAALEGSAVFASSGLSAAAALFWLWASIPRLPNFPPLRWDAGEEIFKLLNAYLGKAARRNAIAAGFSGLAAAAGFVAFYAHAVQMKTLPAIL